jgi:protein SCO1
MKSFMGSLQSKVVFQLGIDNSIYVRHQDTSKVSDAFSSLCLKSVNKIHLVFLLAIQLMACSQKKADSTLPFYNSADFTAEWIAKEDERYKSVHTIDKFLMHDQLGNRFTSDSLNGKIYVANFFFTACPSICPRMTNQLKTVQDHFINNKTIELVSFSVMPWADSIPVLQEYAARNEIVGTKWHLLTGDVSIINSLGRKSYFVEKSLGVKKSLNEFLHTENAILIDRQSRIRGVYNATEKESILRLIEDIEILEVE